MSKKHAVLHIKIPHPCTRDWATFPKEGDGKYCSHCSNIVYDFSQMNDDELLSFFKHKPDTNCGRFHNSQLNRDILPTAKRRQLFLSGFNKIAAALFTLLTFRSASSKAELKNLKPVTVFDSNYQHKSFKGLDGIIITGTVTDAYGKPLEKAMVMFDSVEVARTDKDGKFKFGLNGTDLEYEERDIANHNLYFSYDSLVTVVRSYHPTMLSTNYDVSLYKRIEWDGKMYFTGGEMIRPLFSSIGDLPSLVFKSKSSNLSYDNKAMLSMVAFKLKQNPGSLIIVQAYPTNHQPAISNQRVVNIKKYLVEKEGISEERITTVCEIGGGDPNTVDIKQNEK